MPTGGSSGAAGASGSAGQSAGGAGAPAPPMPVPCGSTMCYPPQNPLSGLLGGMMLPIQLPSAAACCIDESKGTCGTAAAVGATCEARATPDSRCPGVNLGAFGGAAAGLTGLFSPCCTASNQCGLDGMLFGRGCVENSEVGAMLGPLNGFLMLPPARACDAPQEDAGAADAGI
ncbi:MAG TPA: hypothetical protein VJV78_27345 [Polyangiales bacterium]|nr:hypothetical protein [Polyangiales bacterium]